MRHGIVGAALACVLSLGAGAEERHGFAILGTLKYGPDFTHFDYVDPRAPKGGTIRLWFQGTFDSLNPFILHHHSISECGTIATAIALRTR